MVYIIYKGINKVINKTIIVISGGILWYNKQKMCHEMIGCDIYNEWMWLLKYRQGD